MDVLKSTKPSGTYYVVRLIKPYKFKANEPAREPGDEVIVDERLANHLASDFTAAILYRKPGPIWVPV